MSESNKLTPEQEQVLEKLKNELDLWVNKVVEDYKQNPQKHYDVKYDWTFYENEIRDPDTDEMVRFSAPRAGTMTHDRKSNSHNIRDVELNSTTKARRSYPTIVNDTE